MIRSFLCVSLSTDDPLVLGSWNFLETVPSLGAGSTSTQRCPGSLPSGQKRSQDQDLWRSPSGQLLSRGKVAGPG